MTSPRTRVLAGLLALLWSGLATAATEAAEAMKLLDLAPAAPYWIARVPDGSGFRIATRDPAGVGSGRFVETRFDAAGTSVTDPAPVPWLERWTAPFDGSYALLSRDAALHAWAEPTDDRSRHSVVARVTPDGGRPSGAFPLGQEPVEWATDPVLAPCPDGRFAAVWQTRTRWTEGSRSFVRWDVVARAFGPDGTPLAPEAPLEHDGREAHPVAAACGPDGSWLIAWTSRRAGQAGTSLAVQVLDQRGRPRGETVRRTEMGDVHGPVAVGDARGWWVAFEGPGGEAWALAVGPDGQVAGEPLPLGDDGPLTASSPARPSLALGPDGDLFATWECRFGGEERTRLCGRSFGRDAEGHWSASAPAQALTDGSPGGWHGVLATTDGFLVHWTGSERSPRADVGGRAVWGLVVPPFNPTPPPAPATPPETRPTAPSPAN
jgi:hypothetical protein